MSQSLRCMTALFAALVFVSATQAQTLSTPFRKTAVSYFETGAQQQWDEWETPTPDAQDSDSEVNRDFGTWRSDLEFNNPDNYPSNPANIWTAASQDSWIDEASGNFWCYGYALASIYVQGDAESDSESRFRFDVQLDNTGRVVLQGMIGVSNFFGSDQAHDTSGEAKVVVRVIDRSNNTNVYRKVVSMNAVSSARYIDEFEFDDLEVELSAGTYRVVINAFAYDEAIYDQVNFSLANAFVELEGWVEED
ncbi:hypothetical protein [Rhodopirellula sallentina]|nr:hypothetical protein [Rhodopirellula sallentina]